MRNAFRVLLLIIVGAVGVLAQPSPKPDQEVKPKSIDEKPVGEPKKLEEKDGYKLIYSNKDGQVCREEKYNSANTKLESKTIEAIYPNGKIAREEVETFGDKNGKSGVKLQKEKKELDIEGNTTGSETIFFDANGEPERRVIKENGQTREFVAKPAGGGHGFYWDEVFQDTRVEQPDPTPKKEEPRERLEDPCLVGDWETVAVTGSATGGNGFRLTIKRDGTQIVDYSSMEIVRIQDLTYLWRGRAEGKLQTENGVAQNVSVTKAGVTLAMGNKDGEQPARPIATMGPVALGINKNNNTYTCTNQTLNYSTEDYRGNLFLRVTMRRSKLEVTP